MEKKRKKQLEKSYPAALTISGSDSGGSSGIQADLRTFNAFGVYGCCAISGIMSKNPAKSDRCDPVSPEIVTSQIDTVLSAIDIKAVKCGMLFNAGIIEAVAQAAEKYRLKVICDANFDSFTEPENIEVFKQKLLPQASWLIISKSEAELLLKKEISGVNDRIAAAKELCRCSGASILLKGGTVEKNSRQILTRLTDVICHNGKIWKASSLKVDVPQTTAHGAGCTLSAAMTAALALEFPWEEAVYAGKSFVMGSLVENVRIGKNITAMYPPGNDYSGSIQLEEMDVK